MVILPGLVFAQGTGGSDGGDGGSDVPQQVLYNPLGGATTVDSFISKFVGAVKGILYAVAGFFLLFSGFKFVSAQGNETKLKDAKKMFYYTIIGIVIIVLIDPMIAVLKNTFDAVFKGNTQP